MATVPRSLSIALWVTVVVLAAAANAVARRLALVSLRSYPNFLAQVRSLAYVVVYGGAMCGRYGNGTVTAEMLRIPKRPFLWIGFCDCLGATLGDMALSRLPGYQAPLLEKLNIVFAAIFSSLLLGAKYSRSQMCAMALVLAGCCVTLVPLVLRDNAPSSESSSEWWSTLAYVASVVPTALSFVLKEEVFRTHQSLDLDVFVVNTFGSIAALAFTVLILPLAAVPWLGGIQPSDFSAYALQGAACSLGRGALGGNDCAGAPLVPLLYLGINLAFNVSCLVLVKRGGALHTFLANAVAFPLAMVLFVLPWPLLGPETLSGFVVLGLVLELAGLVFYQLALSRPGGGESDKAVQLPEVFPSNDYSGLDVSVSAEPITDGKDKKAPLDATGAFA